MLEWTQGESTTVLICQVGTVYHVKMAQYCSIYISLSTGNVKLGMSTFSGMWCSVYVMLFSPNKLFSMTECCLWTKHKSNEYVCDFNLHATNEGHSEKHSSVGG